MAPLAARKRPVRRAARSCARSSSKRRNQEKTGPRLLPNDRPNAITESSIGRPNQVELRPVYGGIRLNYGPLTAELR